MVTMANFNLYDEKLTEKVRERKGAFVAWKVVNPKLMTDVVTGRSIDSGWNNGANTHVFLNRKSARKFKRTENGERVIKCRVYPKRVIAVTRTGDEAVVEGVFVPSSSLKGKSQ